MEAEGVVGSQPAIRLQLVRERVVADNLAQTLIGLIDIRILDVNHRVDPVLAEQRPKPIFDFVAREDTSLPASALTGQVQLSCPPSSSAVLQFQKRIQESVSARGRPHHFIGGNLEASRLFQLMTIGHEVRSVGSGSRSTEEQ